MLLCRQVRLAGDRRERARRHRPQSSRAPSRLRACRTRTVGSGDDTGTSPIPHVRSARWHGTVGRDGLRFGPMGDAPPIVRARRSAFAAAFLSFLYPGLGHAYLGRWLRALRWAVLPTLAHRRRRRAHPELAGQDGPAGPAPRPRDEHRASTAPSSSTCSTGSPRSLDAYRLARDPRVGSSGSRMLSTVRPARPSSSSSSPATSPSRARSRSSTTRSPTSPTTAATTRDAARRRGPRRALGIEIPGRLARAGGDAHSRRPGPPPPDP